MRTTFHSIVFKLCVLLTFGLLISGCRRTSYFQTKGEPVCPTCYSKKAITVHDINGPGIKMVEAECPSCRTRVVMNNLGLDKIHVCTKCGAMIEECNRCRSIGW